MLSSKATDELLPIGLADPQLLHVVSQSSIKMCLPKLMHVLSRAALWRRCKHNQVYWKGQPFYGFGLGAASLLQGRRLSRPRSMQAYKQAVQDPAHPLPGAHSLLGVMSACGLSPFLNIQSCAARCRAVCLCYISARSAPVLHIA